MRSRLGFLDFLCKISFGVELKEAASCAILSGLGVGLFIGLFEEKIILRLVTSLTAVVVISIIIACVFYSNASINYDENSPLTFEAFKAFYAIAPDKFGLLNIDDGLVSIKNSKHDILMFKTKLDALKAWYMVASKQAAEQDRKKTIEDIEKFGRLADMMREEIAKVNEESEQTFKKVEAETKIIAERLTSKA